jgi:ATP-dependent Clp protease adaptor protein ClpS
MHRIFLGSGNSQDNSPGASEPQESGLALDEVKPKLKEPRKFGVWVLNDDYTTFDFVVEVLMKFFKKTQAEAEKITVAVHHQGKGLAGIYSYEIAETKAAQVCEYSQAHGHPLKACAEALED